MAAGATAQTSAKNRLVLFGVLMFLWAFAICGRLFYLQVYKYDDFVKMAQRQQQRTVDVTPRRGEIYDRNGQELAMSVLVDSVFAVPSEIPDQETTASILAKVLNADKNDLLARLKAGKNFAWVARKIDADTAARIKAMNLRGIYFEKEPKRFYPKRELAAQVLGYVGLDDEGLAGIELQYNKDLAGKPGKMLITMDARRKWFGRVEKQPDPGENVVLTIDEKIQYIAEKELDRGMEDTKAIAGTVVVQNPRTGEILALVNRPTFNPNIAKEITPDTLKDHAVSDIYEPGSVFKTVTYSAAFEEHLANPNEMMQCSPGYIRVGGIKIGDAEMVGLVPLDEAFAKSSDVSAVKIGLRLGPERFYKYIRAYGFGQKTGIELPGETRGLIKPPNRWSGSSIGAMSIGQEVGVTPLQIVSAVSTIANDGVYNAPRIVAGVTEPSRGYQQVVFRPQGQHRIVSPMTAAIMKRFMEQVVLEGTARRAILDGYTSAGKTGTAQKVDPKTHLYSKSNYIASFVGFAPVNTPAITIAVILDSPKGLHQGGQVCAPIWKRIAQQVLAYLDVPHDVEPKNDYYRQLLRAEARQTDVDEAAPHPPGEMADFGSTDSGTAASVPAAYGSGHPEVTAATLKDTNRTEQQTAPASISLAAPEKKMPPHATGSVVLEVDGGQAVPSFIGQSLRQAVQTAEQAGFELQVTGSGVARDQSPAPGTRLPAGSKIAVRFTR